MRLPVLAVVAALSFLLASPSEAQVVRTWVASSGSDSNACTRAFPCRNFAAAIAAVDGGGEVVALDSAGYGPVIISKSVSVVVPAGVHAAIAPTGGSAIQITAGRVTLRNLYLKGHGADFGLEVIGGSDTFADSLIIEGFEVTGIYVVASELLLSQSTSRGNNSRGLTAEGNSNLQRAVVTIDGSRFEKNNSGVVGATYSQLTIRDSLATGNIAAGFAVIATDASATMTLMNCQASRNVYGVLAHDDSQATQALIRIAYSAIVHNDYGLYESSAGEIETQSNNFVQSNSTNTTGGIGIFSGT